MTRKFELTATLLEEILFAMEDVDHPRVFDLSSGALRSPGETGEDLDDPTRFIPLPVWTSLSGFRLMARFAEELRNPLLRDELGRILESGQGVFKKFKAALKDRPSAHKAWKDFKRRAMETEVREWAREWEEYWNWESLDLMPQEETLSLLEEDFTWSRGLGGRGELLADWDRRCWGQTWAFLRRYGAEVRADDLVLWGEGDGEPVGCLWCRRWDLGTSPVWEVLLWYVAGEFRGLGLGSHLLEVLAETVGTVPGSRILLGSGPGERELGPGLRRLGFELGEAVYFRNF